MGTPSEDRDCRFLWENTRGWHCSRSGEYNLLGIRGYFKCESCCHYDNSPKTEIEIKKFSDWNMEIQQLKDEVFRILFGEKDME